MIQSAKKRIIVSVTSDLVSDNRVHKVCTSLHKTGFDILLLGRKRKTSVPLQPREYKTRRFRLWFEKGPLFYACFNLRLFCFLLFSKTDVLLANDLDSLPANFLASKIKNKPLVYDSHEYFTQVPELINRPRIQKTWEWLEKKMVPKIPLAYTVCNSIARVYSKKYGTDFRVVRNVPFSASQQPAQKTNNNPKIILYQGAVNVGRGLKQVIMAMKNIEGAKLIIAGDGDIEHELEQLVQNENLQHKIEFTGRLSIEELTQLTPQADLGLSVEEDIELNYRFTLPNKLFDYIQAHVPVLVTNLPEMAAIVEQYRIGEITPSLETTVLTKKINKALLDENTRKTWKTNLKKAAKELVWEKEEKVLLEIFERFR